MRDYEVDQAKAFLIVHGKAATKKGWIRSSLASRALNRLSEVTVGAALIESGFAPLQRFAPVLPKSGKVR